MKLPRDLSGRALAATLVAKFGYHIVLETDTPSHQRIAIPDHKSFRMGTLSAILRVVSLHKRIDRDVIASSL